VQVAPQLDPAAAAAEQKRKEEREKREARYASLFNGRSSGGNDSTGVPEHLDFKQLKGKVSWRHHTLLTLRFMAPRAFAADGCWPPDAGHLIPPHVTRVPCFSRPSMRASCCHTEG
jgi:hypothetical protein